MKITSIQTSNFLGARAVDLHLTKPVALISGKNGAGKSSIQEAVRMALTGEPVRVSLKKDYATLLSEGAEAGFAEVKINGGSHAITLPAGKGLGAELSPFMPYVLDAQRFARMTDNERRAFLFGLMDVKMDGPTIKERLLAKGCDAAKVEQVMPILRAGFDAASKEAAAKARDAKASWKTATGGETWGKDKAAKWQPAPLPEGAETATDDLEKAKADLHKITGDLDVALQTLGAANASQRQIEEANQKRTGLEAIAANEGRFTNKLSLDAAELAAWEQKVADCRARAGIATLNPKAPGEYLLRGLAGVTKGFLDLADRNPEFDWDSGLLTRASKHLYDYIQAHGDLADESKPDQEAVAKLPEYENALRLMQSAVANSKRDLESARSAASQLKALDELKASDVDFGAVESQVDGLKAKRNDAQARVDQLRDTADKAVRRAALIKQVAKLHADVMSWADIADALAPDGIPAELLAEALDPINEHLRVSATMSEWEPAQINSDMTITYGLRDYALVSESEKWRTDAMIAEAVAHISGLKLLVLDRFDVLDSKGREDLLYWLDGMATDGEIDTALIFGTLRALPALNFETIDAFWIENGATGHLKEAA